jgi:2,3-bisphosphoglycerate-dependent phosphoglycerate mutase
MKTYVYFVRHAEPDISIKDDLIRPLSKKGAADARKVTKALSDKKITAVYSSPYKRAVDTVRDFAESNGFDIIQINDFRERSNGEWVEDFKTYSKNQWKDFDFKLSKGESLGEVQRRNITALFDVIKKNTGKSIAIGSHGTALSTIINYFDPSFGYDGFWGIIDKMPYIMCFEFDGMKLECMKEIAI